MVSGYRIKVRCERNVDTQKLRLWPGLCPARPRFHVFVDDGRPWTQGGFGYSIPFHAHADAVAFARRLAAGDQEACYKVRFGEHLYD